MPSRLHLASAAVLILCLGAVVLGNAGTEKSESEETAVSRNDVFTEDKGNAFVPKMFEKHASEMFFGTPEPDGVVTVSSGEEVKKSDTAYRPEPYVPRRAAEENTAYSNPNFENLEIFLNLVAKEEKAKGLNDAVIQEHAEVIREYARTGPDFRKMFEEEVNGKKRTAERESSLFARIRKLAEPITGAILPTASAFTGVPFGGPILFVYPCTCPPGVFAVTVGPPTPMVLNYAIGSQGFASFNLPASRFVLGLFAPGVQSCFQLAIPACFPIPAAGQIEPIVGSSPI